MENSKIFDEIYLNILKEKQTFPSFLDSVFGFLYRCTDFYQPQDSSQGQEATSALVQKIFKHYEMQIQYEKLNRMAIQFSSDGSADVPSDIPVACCEVEIGSEEEVNSFACKDKLNMHNDTLNGDDRTDYKWSQGINDVDVTINIPNTVRAKDLKITIHPFQLKIELLQQLGEEWTTHISKTFPFRVNTSECVWSLIPGQHVMIHLEKVENRWWDRLFTDDPPINVTLIDTAVPTHELSQEEKMKIEELLRNHCVN